MPDNQIEFSSPSERAAIHTRSITISGYRRDDRLWEIEAVLTDVKCYDQPALYKGVIPAGDPIHHLRARVLVDDALTILRAEAVLDAAPFPQCSTIGPAFSSLAGLGLGTGFMREVRARLGGVKGCTHLTEMMGAIATTAFQTIYPVLRMEEGEPPGRPALIDSCYAFAASGEVVARQWPDYATPPATTVQGATT